MSIKKEPKAIESAVVIKQEPTTAHKRQRSGSSTITSSLAKRPASVITCRQARQGLQGQEQDQDEDDRFDELPELREIFGSLEKMTR